MLVSLPHLTDTEFEHACNKLYSRFLGCADKQSQWLSVEQRREKETFFLSITTALSTEHSNADSDDPSVEEEELVEPDEEVIQTPERCQSLVRYDIFLSPVYQVPVLYIKVTAGSKSSAPSMMSLYEQLVPRQYLDETRTAGIIGGVSLTDHPVSHTPVFFIHPCRTTEVMTASIQDPSINPLEYLLIWLGAMGRCVGLTIPLALADSISSSRPETNVTEKNEA